MSNAPVNAATPWTTLPTETVQMSALKPGDAVFLPGDTSGPGPVRVRAIDPHLNGRVALWVASVMELNSFTATKAGLFTATTSVKRVVLT